MKKKVKRCDQLFNVMLIGQDKACEFLLDLEMWRTGLLLTRQVISRTADEKMTGWGLSDK